MIKAELCRRLPHRLLFPHARGGFVDHKNRRHVVRLRADLETKQVLRRDVAVRNIRGIVSDSLFADRIRRWLRQLARIRADQYCGILPAVGVVDLQLLIAVGILHPFVAIDDELVGVNAFGEIDRRFKLSVPLVRHRRSDFRPAVKVAGKIDVIRFGIFFRSVVHELMLFGEDRRQEPQMNTDERR